MAAQEIRNMPRSISHGQFCKSSRWAFRMRKQFISKPSGKINLADRPAL